MVTYGRSSLESFQPTDDNIYMYFHLVFKNEKFDYVFDILYDRTDIDGFQLNYAQTVDSMDYKNEKNPEEQIRFIHLIPFRGCWLPRYCCCASCIEDLDFFDGTYYYFEGEQLRKQLEFVRTVMRDLRNTTLLIPFCADEKMSKDTWSNTFLPAILDVFAQADEQCIIIPPLDR